MTTPTKKSSRLTLIEQQHELSAANARAALAALPPDQRAALEVRFARIATIFALTYFDDDEGNLDAHVIRLKDGKAVRPPPKGKRQHITVETNPKRIKESFYAIKLGLHIGCFPFPQVDHAKGREDVDRRDRLSNLRVTDAVGNNRNRRPPPRSEENQHLARGVYRHVFPNGRIRYRIRLRDADGIRRSFGYYDTVEEANAVSRAIRLKLHGEHHKATPPNHRPAAQARPAAAPSRPTAKKSNRKAA